jgi:hypothetical protein
MTQFDTGPAPSGLAHRFHKKKGRPPSRGRHWARVSKRRYRLPRRSHKLLASASLRSSPLTLLAMCS